jgi:hypothetical protein
MIPFDETRRALMTKLLKVGATFGGHLADAKVRAVFLLVGEDVRNALRQVVAKVDGASSSSETSWEVVLERLIYGKTPSTMEVVFFLAVFWCGDSLVFFQTAGSWTTAAPTTHTGTFRFILYCGLNVFFFSRC